MNARSLHELTSLKPDTLDRISTFINAHWGDTVRFVVADTGTLLGLPYPYTIPCRRDTFQEQYYWDTYFTCVGLLLSGRRELAVFNTRNLLAQVKRFGYVPNGNRTYYLSRSQPPYLAPLVDLLVNADPDAVPLGGAVPVLIEEYEFWTQRRKTSVGLSHHGNHATREELIEFFPTVKHRLGCPDAKAEDNVELASNTMSECETGWDLSSRFAHRCADFCPVDLNSNLFFYEDILSRWTSGVQKDMWGSRARIRRETVNSLCWDDRSGAWFDYNHVRNLRSEVLTAATFQPLWTGLANASQARAVVEKALPRLESHYGVAPVVPEYSTGNYQWNYPNGWPCIQFLTYRGLARYGYHAEARRIAEKYLLCVGRTYELTGELWEKYDVKTGSHHTVGEAGYLLNPMNLEKADASDTPVTEVPPAMMGWTAGVFLDARHFLAST